MKRALIVLPANNEEVVLSKNARELVLWCAQNLSGFDWCVHIAENGSTDRTAEIAREIAAGNPRVVMSSSAEPGRGRALSRVWSEAEKKFEVLAYMDIDLSADLAALPILLEAASGGRAVSFGSRFDQGASIERSLYREAASRGYRALVRAALGIKARDLQCGFKAVSATAWQELKKYVTHSGWFWDTELIFWAERLNLSLAAVPVHWVETRDQKRKSTVKVIPTALGYLRDISAMRWRLWKERF